jgi:hypothetical protein
MRLLIAPLERNSGTLGILRSVVFHRESNVLFEYGNETHGVIVSCHKKSLASYESECTGDCCARTRKRSLLISFCRHIHSERFVTVFITLNSGE